MHSHKIAARNGAYIRDASAFAQHRLAPPEEEQPKEKSAMELYRESKEEGERQKQKGKKRRNSNGSPSRYESKKLRKIAAEIDPTIQPATPQSGGGTAQKRRDEAKKKSEAQKDRVRLMQVAY